MTSPARSIEEALRDIARAWPRIAEGLGEAFAKLTAALARPDEEAPSGQLRGPRPREHQGQHRRAPRQHRASTALAARSYQPAPRGARHRGYRTGGGR